MKRRTKDTKPAAKRFSVTMTPEIEPALLKLKQEQFFDRSRTEMIQFLLKRGLESVTKGA